jgi:hypothetical protein
MTARLDAARPVIAALRAEASPSLSVPSLGPPSSRPFVWLGAQPRPICYSVPPSVNTRGRNLLLVTPAGSWYPSGIFGPAAAGALPPAAAGCVDFTLPRYLARGRYRAILTDGVTTNPLAAAAFDADLLTVGVHGLGLGPDWIRLSINWAVPAARATRSDTIRLVDRAGRVVAAFSTSQVVSNGLSAVPTGTYSVTVRLSSPPSPPGGFAVRMYVGGDKYWGGAALDWIPWSLIRW